MTAAVQPVTEWAIAQVAEREYWYPGSSQQHAARRAEEEARQAWYAALLRLEGAQPASVLELGAGPQGLVTRYAPNATRKVAVEPMRLTSDDATAYAAAGVELHSMTIEQWAARNPYVTFDEVWMTNVLQHVEDPEAVLAIAEQATERTLRIFEWIEEPTSIVHLHTITSRMIDRACAAFSSGHVAMGDHTAPAYHAQRYYAAVYERRA